MIIPKSYKQFGRTIKVETKASDWDQHYNGIVAPDKSRIRLTLGLERDALEMTYLHEAIHMMLSLMQRDDLYNDEQFVNVMAGLTHQMLHSGKGEI